MDSDYKDDIATARNSICLVEKAYRQHLGECWNDSLLMLLTSCDGIKEDVQERIRTSTAEEIVDEFRHNIIKNDKVKINLDVKQHDLVNYVQTLIDRFNANSKLSIDIDAKVEDNPKIDYSNVADGYSKPILTQRNSFTRGITCAVQGLKILSETNLDDSDLWQRHAHGASTSDAKKLFNLMTCILLDELVSVNLIFPANIDTLISYSEFDGNNLLGYYISCDSIEDDSFGHAMAFVKCNNIKYLYDDNNGVSMCNWPSLKTYIERIELGYKLEFWEYNYSDEYKSRILEMLELSEVESENLEFKNELDSYYNFTPILIPLFVDTIDGKKYKIDDISD